MKFFAKQIEEAEWDDEEINKLSNQKGFSVDELKQMKTEINEMFAAKDVRRCKGLTEVKLKYFIEKQMKKEDKQKFIYKGGEIKKTISREKKAVRKKAARKKKSWKLATIATRDKINKKYQINLQKKLQAERKII